MPEVTDEKFELPPDWRSRPIEKKRQLRRELADDRVRRGLASPAPDDEPKLTPEQAQARIEELLESGTLPPPSELG